MSDQGDAAAAHVNGSQAVQIGTGNTMHANWGSKPPLDPVALGALSPHVAVSRLQQLPHDELVDFFARAKLEDVSEILEVFLEIDIAKVIAALGDINSRKATELISKISEGDKDPLNVLPEAALEIARKAVNLGWNDAGPLKHFISTYYRKYADGHVHWSGESGVRSTTGVIDDYFTANSLQCVGATGDEGRASSSPDGTNGTRQQFRYGTVYSSIHGTYRVVDDRDYEVEGGSSGWLGFPRGEYKRKRGFGGYQNFEGGKIYSYVKRVGNSERKEVVRFAVREGFMSTLPNQVWRPTSKEIDVTSSSGTLGSVQRFAVELESGICETAIYFDKPDYIIVKPEIWDYYSKLGAEKSWLGFPTAWQMIDSPSGYETQLFEEGTIYWRPGISPIAVPEAVRKCAPTSYFDFPVTEQQPMGTGGSDRIQFFNGGVVTYRDGKYEAWVRPSE